jgi:hypothetical protein
MNTAALNGLAETILAAQTKDRTPMGIAFAIDSAGQHLTPEIKDELVRLTARVAELETSARGCDGEGCVLPHSSWCTRARDFAAEHSGCTCGEPWKNTPQAHAGHCWLLSPPDDEMEWHRNRVAELLARVAELEAAAFGDAPVRLLEPIAQIGHLHECVAAQKHRADTLNWICKEQRQRADTAETRVADLEAAVTALEVPWPGNAFPLVLQRSYGHADRWAICDRQGRRWTRGAGWCPESGGIADDRLRDAARFTLAEALPLARRLAAEDPHDSLLHHDYRLGHDLPEMPRG